MARAFAVAGRGEPAAVQDVPTPDLGPGQVRVKVSAASLNGIDVYAAAGYLWEMMPHEFPVVLGRDFAGTVDAVGDGVTTLTPGQRVAGVITAMSLGAGAISTYLVADAASVVPVPDAVTDEVAAAVGLAGVAAKDLVDALALGPADTVLVSGATGGVGALVVQLASATRASVVGTATLAGAEFVRGLGASVAVDYTEDLGQAIKETVPEGITAVVHAAGDPAQLAALLPPGGRFASALGATAEQLGRDDLTVISVQAVATNEKLADLLEAVASGALVVPVARTFALDDAGAGLAAFGDHKQGKLVITLA
jgi:NADPH:quinone reductase-like Zn-dependent oxidoreductase